MELHSESSGAAKALSVVLRDDLAVQRYYMPHVKGGGILVETQNLLPMGTEVLLMLTLPDSQSRAAVMGKVVWVTPKDNREGRRTAIGIQFANDRHGVHTRIQNVLSGLPICSDNILTF